MKNHVSVYRNLHKKCWSVKVGKEPVKHVKSICLANCFFKIWEGGRAKVLQLKRKLVHAFACGTPCEVDFVSNLVEVSYNPYFAGYFFEKEQRKRIDTAKLLVFTHEGKVYGKL